MLGVEQVPREKRLTKDVIARAKKTLLQAAQQPRPRKLRKRLRPHRSRIEMMKAIRKSKGIWSILARRLGCTIVTAQNALKQEGWELLLEAFEDERLRTKARPLENILVIADYSADDGTRFNANKWLDERLNPEFQRTKKLIVEGGDRPVQLNHVIFQVDKTLLNAPVKDRVRVLEMIEERERELDGTDS